MQGNAMKETGRLAYRWCVQNAKSRIRGMGTPIAQSNIDRIALLPLWS